jgi:hypothetical protein
VHRNCSVCSSEYNKKFSFKCDINGNFLFDGFQAIHNFCSTLCYVSALKMNKSNLYDYSDDLKLHQSKLLKEKILNGEFTPAVTNSWSRSRIIYGDMKFRSSWELLFYFSIKNKAKCVKYEAIRIPYYDTISNLDRIYIVDFLVDGKLLVEVKPSSLIDGNINKFQALVDYSNQHGYEYLICDEMYLLRRRSAAIAPSHRLKDFRAQDKPSNLSKCIKAPIWQRKERREHAPQQHNIYTRTRQVMPLLWFRAEANLRNLRKNFPSSMVSLSLLDVLIC